MARRGVRIGAVAAATVLAVGLVPGTAHAATGNVNDPRGDAPKVADITKLKFKNGTYRATGVITVPHRKLKKLAFTNLEIKPKRNAGWIYIVSIHRDAAGKVTDKTLAWQQGDDPSTYTPVPCTGIRQAWIGKRTKISVPQSCLTKHHGTRLKARAGILARVGPGHDFYDDRTRYTRYLKRG
ncbi:hypothetical protein [Mumia sp. Pv 4-285]|uniref:hypothetical protein n=1 Tax=Mumia qirimensis TaxID=3234852 RepID=UPI00351D2C79